MIKYLLIAEMNLFGQIPMIATGEAMDSILKSEESELELTGPEEYVNAKPFFTNFKINQPILHGMLENKSAGKVFTDNKTNPSFMLVCSPAGYVFLGGEPSQASLVKIASYLKTLPYVSLVSPLDWKFKDFFVRVGFSAVDRIQFQRRAATSSLDSWKNKLPNQYPITRINQENFPQCNWQSFILSCYGERDRFFSNGVGFCLTDQGRIVSESYGLIAADKAEIGVVTDPSYYGQNLGTCICAIMLEYCYEHNIE
ncbi:MAG: GNAT family N-acetyltransferase, partial [Parachlamydiaceae bacterium]|nr:GNAT family N-acetyltransferase [Parachlamydiaceae bacterium]